PKSARPAGSPSDTIAPEAAAPHSPEHPAAPESTAIEMVDTPTEVTTAAADQPLATAAEADEAKQEVVTTPPAIEPSTSAAAPAASAVQESSTVPTEGSTVEPQAVEAEETVTPSSVAEAPAAAPAAPAQAPLASTNGATPPAAAPADHDKLVSVVEAAGMQWVETDA